MWWRDHEKRRNDDFVTVMTWIMKLDAKLDEIKELLEDDDDESD